MSKRYKITVNGRARYYETLQAARDVANEIFARTGIVVGIEAARPPLDSMYRGRMIDGNMYRGR